MRAVSSFVYQNDIADLPSCKFAGWFVALLVCL